MQVVWKVGTEPGIRTRAATQMCCATYPSLLFSVYMYKLLLSTFCVLQSTGKAATWHLFVYDCSALPRVHHCGLFAKNKLKKKNPDNIYSRHKSVSGSWKGKQTPSYCDFCSDPLNLHFHTPPGQRGTGNLTVLSSGKRMLIKRKTAIYERCLWHATVLQENSPTHAGPGTL